MTPDTALFDTAAFDETLNGGGPPLPLFRTALRSANAILRQRFESGTPASQLVPLRAWLVDNLLRRAWQQHLGAHESQMALVAVGGYGRGELHPHSDIDLMLLTGEEPDAPMRTAIEQFLMFLWDIGLEVGHSVRSVEQCVQEAEADITVATNIMESRLLAGAEPLFVQMRQSTGPDRIWPSREFFEAKWQEQIARHRKFYDTSYNLEPNIKEGPGGLRDIQMIGWVTKRHFGAETLKDLVEHGFLTAAEYKALIDGQNFLWQIRFALHIVAGRREDRLLFDHQRVLARMFGYHDTGPRLAVEQFMKRYYRTVMELNRLNEMLLQLYQEAILLADEPAEPQPINRRFQARNGFLEVTHDQIFERYPFALLELFLLLCQHPQLKGVRAETIRLVRSHLPLIDAEFRHDLRCRSLFMEILRQPFGVTHELRRMNRYGVLAAYLPNFGRIVGQMQHDLFHVYTVDEHTLFVVRNLRRLTVPEFAGEFPLCSRIINRIPKPELLYIAALFHDIAKGRGGDHSALGEKDATEFCRDHMLSDFDTHLVAWLVRNHLIMSTTAQRKDISDPDVVNEFAAQVGNRNRLDYLYLLTVADIRATSPSVWNSWKDALLAELYHATGRALRRGLANPIDEAELIDETQREALSLLDESPADEKAIRALWQRLDGDYFLRYSADEIAWHAHAILNTAPEQTPLVMARQETERGGTELFIYTPAHDRLFALTTTALDQMGLDIVDARITSSRDGYTFDTYIVLEEDGAPISNGYRIQELQQTLRAIVAHPESAPDKVHRQLARQLKHFPIPTQVTFLDDPGNDRSMMEVVSSDRPGLLAQIGRALTECGVRLQNAKIATFGERVEDIFFITDSAGHRLSSEAQQAQLRQRIIETVEGG